jgi:hypothetical protein
MKLGADNPKKVIITAGLMVFALVLFVYMVFDKGSPATAAASNASQPGASTPATESRLAAHKAAVKSRVSDSLDPSLRTDLLLASEGVVYNGTGRNIFKAEPDPPPLAAAPICAQPGGPSHGMRWCQPLVVPPRPRPPDIPLKFFGFANKPGEPKKAFLSQGDDIFIASEGDIVDRRYKIVRITATSVDIEDVLNENTQTIPLTEKLT